MAAWSALKDLFTGTSGPSSPATPSKRKARAELRRASKIQFGSPYSPREYQTTHYGGTSTMTTTDEDTDTEYPKASSKVERTRLKGLQESPTKPASPEKIRKAAEARAFLQKAAQSMEDIGGSDAERLAASIERMEGVVDEMTEQGKGKEPVMATGIVEIQPGPEDLSDFESEEGGEDDMDVDVEEIVATRPTAESVVESPIKTTAKPGKRVTKTSTPEIGEKPTGWNTFPTTKKWTAKPNLRARELLHEITEYQAATTHIAAEIKEPEYSLRDVEIRDGLWQVMDQMERFAKLFFGFEYAPTDGVMPVAFYESLTPQTAKVIGCVASGGPASVYGWHDLFINEQKRRALVCAIMGNVLVEQVFQHIFFGGEKDDIRAVTGLQEKYRDEDGFERNKHYALAIRKILKSNSHEGDLELPNNFNNHVNHIIGALWTHLKPIFSLDEMGDTIINDNIFDRLHKLVTQAGLLSLHMRMDPHTVYHIAPVFKEDIFSSKSMECFNFADMQQRHPRTEVSKVGPAEQARRAKLSDKEKKRARNDEPLTQITIMDGVTAYRLGGWEKPSSKVVKPLYEKPEYKTQGVRARILTHAWVYCRWGRARRFKDGKPDDGDETRHGDAWRGGFVEFTDVEGVYPWLEEERMEKQKERNEAGTVAEKEKAADKGKGKGRAIVVEDDTDA